VTFLVILAVAGAAVWAGLALWRSALTGPQTALSPGEDVLPSPGAESTGAPGLPALPGAPGLPALPATPGPDVPAAPQAPTPGAAPEPDVPVDLPTPAPGLDRELAGDYREALTKQGINIVSLEIADARATGGARRAEIAYRTGAGPGIAALRPEIVRILGPGANPRLALDQITVRAVGRGGAVVASVTVSVPDLDRWLRAQITDEEFYSRWVVGGSKR
jgi:hypothetical protein